MTEHDNEPPSLTERDIHSMVLDNDERAVALICLPSFDLCVANDRTREIFSRRGIELTEGRPIAALFAPDDWRRARAGLAMRLLMRSAVWSDVTAAMLSTGDAIELATTWIPVADRPGSPGHLLCYLEEVLDEPGPRPVTTTVVGATLDADLERIVGQLGAPQVVVFDPAGRLAHIGGGVAPVLGNTAHLLGRRADDLGWPEAAGAALLEAVESVRDRLVPTSFVVRLEREVLVAHAAGFSPTGRPPAALVVVNLVRPTDPDLLDEIDSDTTRDLRVRVDYLERRLQAIAREARQARWDLRQSTGAADDPVSAGLPLLSPREREVFDLIASGLRVPTIAKRLYVNQSTVRNHLSSVFRKLGVESQAELLELIRSDRD